MSLSKTIKSLIKKSKRKLGIYYSSYNGIVLPPAEIRYMSQAFNDDKYYLDSSFQESERLTTKLGVNRKSEILEIGSATGRMVIGLIQKLGEVKRYTGLDISPGNVKWCNQYIAKRNKFCTFLHIDVQHPKYNKTGTVKLDENFRLPFDDESFDVIYANSVFANNVDTHIKAYSKDFFRILRPGGRVFLTAFIEENVPDMTINPENYVMKCLHPYHIVRFEKNYFLGMFTSNGFRVDLYEQGTEIDTQSAVYFSKPK